MSPELANSLALTVITLALVVAHHLYACQAKLGGRGKRATRKESRLTA